MRISEAAEQFLTQRGTEGYSPHTLDCYRLQLKLLARAIGDRPVEEIALPDLRGYIASCTHLKPASLAHRVRVIRVFCKWLVEEDHLLRNPASRLKEPKLPSRVPKFLTPDELEALRDQATTSREKAMLEFFFATGCRLAEVTALERSSIDWGRRSIIVMGKGNKERECYFSPKAALYLKRYLDGRKDDNPALFVSERGARRLSGAGVEFVFRELGRKAGIRAYPHRCRHTFGTFLLNQGASLPAVQGLMGHKKPETTQLYAQLSGAQRQHEYQKYFVQ